MVKEEIINDVVYNLRRLTSLENIDFKTVEQSRRYDYDLTINDVTFAYDVRTLVNKANCNLIVQQLRKLKGQINEETGLSLGTIKNVIEELANGQYVVSESIRSSGKALRRKRWLRRF